MKTILIALAIALLVGGYLVVSRIDFDDEVLREQESKRAAEDRDITLLTRAGVLPLSSPVKP